MNQRQGLIAHRRPIRARYNDRLRRRLRKPIPRSVVPSFFTLMNLFSGFLAILQISEGQMLYGAWLIVMAGLFDVLDGFMARLTNGTSEFGIELDSLSDLVSFGAAPGFLAYNFSLYQLEELGMILSSLPALCGSIRLARFNVEARDDARKEFFKGLPIPAQAMMVVAFVLLFQGGDAFFDNLRNGVNSVFIPLVILLSGLMVTTVPFDKIPRITRSATREQRMLWLWFLAYVVMIVLFRHYGLMLAFSIFIIKGLVRGAVKFWRELNADEG